MAGQGAGEKVKAKKVTLRNLALFCRQLGTLYEAGIPIMEALRTVSEQVPSKYFGVVIRIVADDLAKGHTLAWALERHPVVFPPILTSVVAAGEASGNLDDALRRSADHFEREHEIREKVRTAMVYPAFIVVVAFFVCVFMVVVVIPNFAGMFLVFGGVLPWPTRFLIWLSETAQRYIVHLGVGLGIVFILVSRYLQTEEGQYRRDWLLLKVPVISQMLLLAGVARFCRTMSALIDAGIPVVVGLGLAEKSVNNQVLGLAINETKEAVRGGKGIAEPLRSTGAFPVMVPQMIAVGEETGQIGTMLDRLAGYYEKDLGYMTDSLTRLIEPIMLIILAVLVGFIVIAMVLPMFDMWTLIK